MKARIIEVPSAREVKKAVNEIRVELNRTDVWTLDGAEDGVDIRLQVELDGSWRVLWGDPGYDQSHKGFWGSAGLMADSTASDAGVIACELLDQVEDSIAEAGFEVGHDALFHVAAE